MNQCWNIVNWTLRNQLQWNFNRISNIFIQENGLEDVVCEMVSILSRPQFVNKITPSCAFSDSVSDTNNTSLRLVHSWPLCTTRCSLTVLHHDVAPNIYTETAVPIVFSLWHTLCKPPVGLCCCYVIHWLACDALDRRISIVILMSKQPNGDADGSWHVNSIIQP